MLRNRYGDPDVSMKFVYSDSSKGIGMADKLYCYEKYKYFNFGWSLHQGAKKESLLPVECVKVRKIDMN